MFPFIVIAAVAALLLSQKNAKASPAGGMGETAPPELSSGPPTCELDDSIVEPFRGQILRLVAQVERPGLTAGEAEGVALALDQLATPIEMGGYKKLAECLRGNAAWLRERAKTLPESYGAKAGSMSIATLPRSK